MKNLDLNAYGVCEMSRQELLTESGGMEPSPMWIPLGGGLGEWIYNEFELTWKWVMGDLVPPSIA
jgi:hypothetical protein